jgi:hypothetical protein
MNLTHIVRRNWSPAVALAGLLILGSGLIVWQTQYYLDYEVTLLPWLVGRGWSLYTDIADQHTPLLAWLLSPTGGDPQLLRLLIVVLHLLTLTLVSRLASILAGWWVGLVATGLAALWLHSFEATHLWYETAQAPLYLGAATLLVRPLEPRGGSGPRVADRGPSGVRVESLALAGVLLGLAVLIKQHALVPALVILVWLIASGGEMKWRRAGHVVAGFAAALSPAALVLGVSGTLGDAFFWTVQHNLEGGYARAAALPPGPDEWPALISLYAGAVPLVLALFFRALPLRVGLLILGLAVAASVPAWPRFARFHLAAAAPLVAVAGAVGSVTLWHGARGHDGVKSRVATALGFGVLGVSLIAASGQAWQVLAGWGQLGSPQPPYAEGGPALKAWVAEQTARDEAVFVYGLDPYVSRLIEREPPRPFVPQLPWMLEARGMERAMWEGVGRERPPIVLVPEEWWEGTSPDERSAATWPGIGEYASQRRFSLISYPGAPPTEIVGLVREGR